MAADQDLGINYKVPGKRAHSKTDKYEGDGGPHIEATF